MGKKRPLVRLQGGHATFRRMLQRAYDQPTCGQANTALKKARAELNELDQSSAASLDEGFEETLTLHRLGLFKELSRSFKTTPGAPGHREPEFTDRRRIPR